MNFKVFGLAMLIIAIALIAITPKASRAADPTAEAIRDHLSDFSLRMDDLVAIDALQQAIPLTELTLDDPDALALGNLFQDSLGATLAAIIDPTSPSDLLDQLVAATSTVGDVSVSFTDPASTSLPDQADVEFTMTATHAFAPPVAITTTVPSGADTVEIDLFGGGLPLSLTLSADFHFRYFPGVADPAFQFAVVGEPTILVTVKDSAAGVPSAIAPFSSTVGFADVEVSGEVDLSMDIGVTLLDPDGSGLISNDELTNTTVIDLTGVATTGLVDASLSLDSPLAGVLPGSVVLVDDPSDGVDEPSVVLGDDLEAFTNVNAAEVLSGLSEFASGLVAAQLTADLDLPFLRESLSASGIFAGPLATYIRTQGDAAIICGPQDTDPPLGDTSRLISGDLVYCQAVTAVEGTSVTWDSGSGGSVDANGSNVATVGTNPTERAEITLGVEGIRGISVFFIDEDGTPHDVVQRFRTVGELTDGLVAEGLSPVVTYDPTTRSLTYGLSALGDGPATPAQLDFGSFFVDDTRLRGLSSTPLGGATVTQIDVSLAATFGVILVDDVADITPLGADDPNIEDRFFIGVGPGPELAADAEIVATLDMEGLVGYVGVNVDGGLSTYSAGRLSPADPMVAVDIAGPGIEVDIAGGLETIAEAIRVRELLADLSANVSFANNVGADITLEVSAVTADATPLGSGVVTIGYADTSPLEPGVDVTVATDVSFDETL